MHRRKTWNESGVSEVVGTILILGMTVVLFASIILWVSTFPTPSSDVRTDMAGILTPIYDANGNWKGVNITVLHKGGETLKAGSTKVGYRTDSTAGVAKITILKTRGTDLGTPYGINGPPTDADWNTGETWYYSNYSTAATDRVTIIVADTTRNIILWTQQLQGAQGKRPPIFLEKWADRLPNTPTIDIVQTNLQFSIFAKVTDPDGDLNRNSVFVFLAFLYGTPQYGPPQKMYDDGTNGDLIASDGTFSAAYANFVPTDLSWDGGVVIFNATDLASPKHSGTSRMTLSVEPGPTPPKKGGGTGNGRPPNLNYNGLQGFNIFNGTEWDTEGFNATDTRVFKGNEQVVVIVGSAILQDLFGRNVFTMWDPFAFQPTPVVYGSNKNVGPNTKPSSTNAFTFFQFVNGYNVWIYRFDLNNASVGSSCTANGGICFKKVPAHPPEYFFATYSVEFDLIDFLGNHFAATDAITIKDTDGSFRNYPQLNFYRDQAYTLRTNTFNSTDNIWVAVTMLDVDVDTSKVSMGTVEIRDFLGGTQIQKAFSNVEDPAVYNDENPPICRVAVGTCVFGQRALSLNTGTNTYRFRLNLSRADQDPWVEGTQHYSLSIAFVHDVSSNEQYAAVSAQLVIIAPLFRLDIVGGNADGTNPAWGTHDYGYYYESLNGADKWRKTRYEFCGLPGTGSCKSAETHAVAFLDGDQDGDLDVTASVVLDNNNAELNYYRRDIDSNGNVVFSKFILTSFSGNGIYCSDIEVGDLTGDAFPEIVCGRTDGLLLYFKNDGTWTSSSVTPPVTIDSTRNQAINGVTIADFDKDADKDIAVARTGGTVTYYLNLDGRGTFSTGGITDNWVVDQESLRVGTVVPPTSGNDYQRTYGSDDSREELQEANYTEPVQNGNTLNPTFDTDSSSWSSVQWEPTATLSRQGSGGNPNGLVQVDMTQAANQFVSGFWYQQFTISGSTPFSGTVVLDYKVSLYGAGAGGNVKIYVFVDKTAGNPTLGQEIASWTETATTIWKSQSVTVPSSKLPAAGTYYLKFVARTQNGVTPAGHTVVQFDNARLSWSSTGGNASELLHYWRIQQLPNRPSTTFTLRVEGQRSTSIDGDTFNVGFATNVVGNDPTTGTYKNVIWINSTATDVAYTYTFNATENTALRNAVVWLRLQDTNHIVGNVTFDIARLDQIYIQANTQAVPPGSSITLPATPGDATSIDSDDTWDTTGAIKEGGDGYADVVVGTSNSKVYKLVGFSGGLQTPAGALYTAPGGTIVGIKLANITTVNAGLEIVFAFSNRVRVITAGGTQVGTDQTTTTAIHALGAGDMDGDGDDDVVVGTVTTANALVYFRNQGNGASWDKINVEPIPGGTTIEIFDLYLGDGSKSQYGGR